MKRFRIAIDVREVAGSRAGKGRYVAGLLEGLAKLELEDVNYLLYTRHPLPPGTILPKHSQVILLPTWRIPGLRPLWTAWHIKRHGADVFLSPTGFLPALFSLVPSAIVVHDLAVWKARNHPRGVVLQEKLLLPLALRRARAVFVVSRHTGEDLREIFASYRRPMTVAYAAVDERYHKFAPSDHRETAELQRVRNAYNLPEQYILFVGTLEPRKNLRRLIEAYHHLPAASKAAVPLIVTGKKGWGYDEIFARVTELKETEHVRFLGYVPEADLPALYNQATIVAYPSLYEGFGIPPLEAMACGVAVLTSRVSSLPEVVGDAAVLVDPLSPDEITAGLEKLLNHPQLRLSLGRAGLKQAREFSWKATAQTVIDTLRSMAKR